MDTPFSTVSLLQNIALQNSNNNAVAPNAQRSTGLEAIAPSQVQAVPLNQDIPTTSQIDAVQNQTTLQTNQTNNAQPAEQVEVDQDAQQTQIETALSEITGIDVQAFAGIDVQTALDIQESFRDRGPTVELQQNQPFSPAPAAFESPDDIQIADTTEQVVQQRLQDRLADRIPNDPGTVFPQLIQTVV